MLRSILSPATCADCRNCCVFEEQSTWELPTFSAKTAQRMKNVCPDLKTKQVGENRVQVFLKPNAGTQPCPFLDPASGCTLPPEEKPFACSLWPVRVMRTEDGNTVLTLYQGCNGMTDAQLPALYELLKNGLKARILAEIQKDETLILPYHPNYRILDIPL